MSQTNRVKDEFEGENMQTQCSVLVYIIDLYFHEYKLAIEVDALGHNVRNTGYEIQRQWAIKKVFGYMFSRTNPDKKKFNIFKVINEIHGHIKKSNKKLTEESIRKLLIDDISKKY